MYDHIKEGWKKSSERLAGTDAFWERSTAQWLLKRDVRDALKKHGKGKLLDAGAGTLSCRHIAKEYCPEYVSLDFKKTHTELVEIMSKLKDEGKIAHVGIATRGEEVPLAAIETGFFETIQTAYSIVDQRMAPKVLPKAQEHTIGIINRSVLLKGSLSPARVNLPSALQPLKDTADQAEAIATEHGMILPVLAIRFCLSHPAVSTALIGTTKIDRLEKALQAAQEGPLPQEILDKLYPLAISDTDQIDPSRWPK